MFPVWEAGVKDGICIDPVECVVSHAVVAVGRLELRDSQTSPWRTAYVGRYMNCYRGSEKDNYHAEQFMLEDSDLEAAIKAKAEQRLRVSESGTPQSSSLHDVAGSARVDDRS